MITLQYNRYYTKGSQILKYLRCSKTAQGTTHHFRNRATGKEIRFKDVKDLQLYDDNPNPNKHGKIEVYTR